MSSRTQQYPERSVADVLVEIKDELKAFVDTRYQLLRSEVSEAVKRVRSAVPLAAAAVLFFVTAYALLTIALVALVAVAFWNSPYHWFFAFLIVGLVWACTGGILSFLVYNDFRKQGLLPKQTVEILKRDKRWLETEVRGQHVV